MSEKNLTTTRYTRISVHRTSGNKKLQPRCPHSASIHVTKESSSTYCENPRNRNSSTLPLPRAPPPSLWPTDPKSLSKWLIMLTTNTNIYQGLLMLSFYNSRLMRNIVNPFQQPQGHTQHPFQPFQHTHKLPYGQNPFVTSYPQQK